MGDLLHDFVSSGGPERTRGRIEKGAAYGFLCVDHPVALARFIAYAKQHCGSETRVFFRGERGEHPEMVPILFRNGHRAIQERRLAAYHSLVERLPKKLKVSRFDRTNSGSVLQHYGISTPWLDAVDNMYTAVWFAVHRREDCPGGKVRYVRRNKGEGWVVLIADRVQGHPSLIVNDLRATQASLSVRLHAQHGVTLGLHPDTSDELTTTSLTSHVVARVRFALSPLWRLRGFTFDQRFLFPGADLDHTYRILGRPRVQALVRTIEREHGVEDGLGRIDSYCLRVRAPAGRHCQA